MREPVSAQRLARGWRLARFGELLRRIERKVVIDDSTTYACVGVRWYGLGAFVRQDLLGLNIARKQHWVVKAGDILYNKLFAWKGAFAIADESVENCIVSDKFPTYAVNSELLDPSYLRYYFRAPQLANQAQNLSKGGAAISKLTLNPPQFWDLVIPMPPRLDDQRRIVARVTELEVKTDEARALRRRATAETQALVASFINQRLQGVRLDARLGDVLVEKPRNGWSARCDNVETGAPVLTLGAIRGYRYRETEFKRTSEPTSPHAHYWLREGDLLITRSNTAELVGHAAIYNGSPSPCIYPDLMMRLVIDERHAEKRFVHFWLMSPIVRAYINRVAKGTSPTMKKISQTVVMNIPFPSSLSVSEQRRFVAHISDLQTSANTLTHLQTDTSFELATLFHAILTRAFSGEL